MIAELGFNKIDFIICGFVGFFGILGLLNGAIRQFFSILAFVFAGIVSAIVPYFIKLPFIQESQPVWSYIILIFIIWLPAYLILSAIGKFIAGHMLKKGLRIGDHFWGLLFGFIKGLIIIIVVIFLIDLLPASIKEKAETVNEEINASKIISRVKPFNPFIKLHIMQNLNMIITAINDPDYMELLSRDKNFKKLINQKSIKEIIHDPELKKMIEDREYLKFIKNKKIRQLVKDPEALKLLFSTDVDKTVIKNI